MAAPEVCWHRQTKQNKQITEHSFLNFYNTFMFPQNKMQRADYNL